MTTTYVNDITVSTRIVAITCNAAKCGVVFGLSAEFVAARRDDHRTWYCPNGHARCWSQDNEEERLQKALTRAQSQATHLRDQLEATERQRRAQKGQVTKIKRRIANGVCPSCQRSFADLHRHMAGQHPDYAEQTP